MTRVAGRLAMGMTIGWLLLAPANSLAAVAAQPNGKVLVTVAHHDEVAVARLDRDGRIDRSFGRRGFASTGIGAAAQASDVIVGPSGAIDVAVQFHGLSRFALAVVQLTRDGELDRSFGVDGLAQPFGVPGVTNLGALAHSGDGQLLVAASAETQACGPLPTGQEPCQFRALVFGLNADGQLDPSFDGDGVAEADALFSTSIELAVGADGRIVVGALSLPGSSTDGRPYSYVSRFQPDGSIDPTFGGASEHIVLRSAVSGLAVSDGGRIYSGGAAEGLFTATAINPDGTVDGSFGIGGSFTNRIGEVIDGAGSLIRRPNGDLILGGPVASRCRPRNPVLPGDSRCRLSAVVVRLNAAGNPIDRFGDDAVTRFAISRSRMTYFDARRGVEVVDSRDGVRVATPMYNGGPQDPAGGVAIAALRNDGSLDLSFGRDGLTSIRAEPR